MAELRLSLRKYEQEGDLSHEYQPLRNYLTEEGEVIGFDVSDQEWPIDITKPLSMECQPSYDGTVNLIINDDFNPPRIINTRFTKLEDNRYKIINRNQKEQTNLYKEGKIDQQTRLFRNINHIPKIDLMSISNIGQLKGGNYTFYIKFADNDYNKTDMVAESGIVSVFKGYENKPSTISGTVFDERTDKSITLKVSNIDTSFSKVYVYYIRETSDQNGIRVTKAGMYTAPYEIKDSELLITINGFEEEEELTPEEINIQYNIVTAAKTQTQVQNMLFFGNVQCALIDVKNLQNLSYYIKVSLKQREKSIGYISPDDYTQRNTDDVSQSEYYNTNNIYYNLGYWPDEIYRLGVVYILNDDSLTPVFNLRGCSFDFTRNVTSNFDNSETLYDSDGNIKYLERDEFLNGKAFLSNTFGVFKTFNQQVITNNGVKPLYFEMDLSLIKDLLKNYGIKGFFFVRQKRIPTNLCQGFSIGLDRVSHIPLLFNNNNANTQLGEHNNKYFTESFLSKTCTLGGSFVDHIVSTESKQGSGLLCLDATVNAQLQSNFDGSDFVLCPAYTEPLNLFRNNRHFYTECGYPNSTTSQIQSSVVFVNSDTPMKFVNGNGFSTRCGIPEDVSKFSFFAGTDKGKADNQNILRGIYTSFLGTSSILTNNMLYTIKVPNYTSVLVKDYFLIRAKDTSPFYAISNRYELDEAVNTIDCYRGDCYSNTVTIRMNRNFVDSEVPVNDIIIDPDTWKKNYKGYNNMKDAPVDNDPDKKDEELGYFSDINRADVNTAALGMWFTYKCLSNYNLGLRTVDTSYVDEYALMGTARGFYPVVDMSTVSAAKVEDSSLLNDGYNSTVGYKRNFIVDNVPYIKELYDNRIMFSNVQRDDDFQNAYRIFQGLSFKDIDRQYGAIVKFIPYGVNIFCVFEHGLGIIPINEKALIQTGTNQSIHMYGAGVIQNQITLISPDFGSIWPESVIRTPVGIYGVDTYAKKIWRYSDKGLETISDMKIQRFLNDNIKIAEKDKYPIISLRNVKSHFNNYKGDVMFTLYNYGKDETWNLCFNERLNKWITRYSWTPLYSENINNIFYSFDQDRAKLLAYVYDNQHCNYGLHVTSNKWNVIDAQHKDYSETLSMVGYDLYDSWTYTITSVETGYVNNGSSEYLTVTDPLFTISDDTISGNYSNIKNYFDNLNINMPVFFKVNIEARPVIESNNQDLTNVHHEVLAIVVNNKYEESDSFVIKNIEAVNAFLRNGVYVHGKAGAFNEIDYRDQFFNNEILPTLWYEKQEPFEFEFVVNDEVGLHKIFDNLVIISNNVQPNQIEYEIIGDVYKFNKTGIFRRDAFGEGEWDSTYNKPKLLTGNEKRIAVKPIKYQSSQEFDNCRVVWDDVLNQYSLITTQDCKNIEEYGRRLGNIQYKEDSWYITIEPIKYYEKYKIEGYDVDESTKTLAGGKYMKKKEARIRDKFVKIRVKYTGEDMVVVTALKTILTPSYS